MIRYFIKRILLIIPTFLGITLIVFLVTRFVPGGPIDQYIQEAQLAQLSGGPTGGGITASRSVQGQPLSDEDIEKLKALYGFDKPVLIAYVEWLWGVVRFDFGNSTRYHDSVLGRISNTIPISLYFGIINLFFLYAVSLPLGIYKALKHRTVGDHVTSVLLFVGYSIPAFVFGLLLIVFFGYYLSWFPLGGFTSENFQTLSVWGKIGDLIYHTTLPLLCYMLGQFTVLTLMMKNNLMENMASDYVRTAVAKGRTFRESMWRHAFRNSIIPIASGFGSIITIFLSGSFLIEKIFNIRGMGYLGYISLVERDYPVVMGILVLSSLASLLGNVLSDLLVALVDPRIRFQ